MSGSTALLWLFHLSKENFLKMATKIITIENKTINLCLNRHSPVLRRYKILCKEPPLPCIRKQLLNNFVSIFEHTLIKYLMIVNEKCHYAKSKFPFRFSLSPPNTSNAVWLILSLLQRPVLFLWDPHLSNLQNIIKPRSVHRGNTKTETTY